MLTFDSAEITNYSLTNGTKSHDYVLSADFSVITFKISNSFVIFMICFVILLILLFFVFPLFLLFFYPTKIRKGHEELFRDLLSTVDNRLLC